MKIVSAVGGRGFGAISSPVNRGHNYVEVFLKSQFYVFKLLKYSSEFRENNLRILKRYENYNAAYLLH